MFWHKEKEFVQYLSKKPHYYKVNDSHIKVKKHKVLFKKFTQDEIQDILKKIESIDGFKKSRQLRQTARTYQTEISAASSRKDFIRSMKEILDDSDYKYSLNFDRKKIFITKFRVGKKGKDEAGLVEM